MQHCLACLHVISLVAPAQVQALRLAGKGLYPAWVGLVRQAFAAASPLTHFRLVMGSCVAPCLVGFVVLLAAACGHFGDHRLRPNAAVAAAAAAAAVVAGGGGVAGIELQQAGGVTPPAAPGTPAGRAVAPGWLAAAAAVAAGLAVQGGAAALFGTAWPLFVNRHFGWADLEFAPLLLASSLASVGGPASFHGVSRCLPLPRRRCLSLRSVCQVIEDGALRCGPPDRRGVGGAGAAAGGRQRGGCGRLGGGGGSGGGPGGVLASVPRRAGRSARRGGGAAGGGGRRDGGAAEDGGGGGGPAGVAGPVAHSHGRRAVPIILPHSLFLSSPVLALLRLPSATLD